MKIRECILERIIGKCKGLVEGGFRSRNSKIDKMFTVRLMAEGFLGSQPEIHHLCVNFGQIVTG